MGAKLLLNKISLRIRHVNCSNKCTAYICCVYAPMNTVVFTDYFPRCGHKNKTNHHVKIVQSHLCICIFTNTHTLIHAFEPTLCACNADSSNSVYISLYFFFYLSRNGMREFSTLCAIVLLRVSEFADEKFTRNACKYCIYEYIIFGVCTTNRT